MDRALRSVLVELNSLFRIVKNVDKYKFVGGN